MYAIGVLTQDSGFYAIPPVLNFAFGLFGVVLLPGLLVRWVGLRMHFIPHVLDKMASRFGYYALLWLNIFFLRRCRCISLKV